MTRENETAALGPGSSRAPGAHATSAEWAVDRPGTKEECTEGIGANVASTVQSEVEDNPPNWAIDVGQSAASIEGVVDCGTGNQADIGTDGRSELRRPVGLIGPTDTPSAEGVEGDTRSLDGFWQLLADAGYVVW